MLPFCATDDWRSRLSSQQASQICSFTIARATANLLQAIRPGQLDTWQLRWTQGTIKQTKFWNYHLPEETRRGLADQEDLYSPGYLVTTLQPGAVLT